MRRRVDVIYPHYPHYRRGIMCELASRGKFSYRFWGSTESVEGIIPFSGDDRVVLNPLTLKQYGRLWLLGGYWAAVFDRSADALVVLGNPNMPATWWISLISRVVGKKVIFWAHGWLKPEPPVKRLLRNAYFRLAHGVLVYNERAKKLAADAGFPPDRVTVIYNSLDYEASQRALAKVKSGNGGMLPQALFDEPSFPLMICTARLTDACRFELLFAAAAKLQGAGRPVNILLVGDGPERERLEQLAGELGIAVHFFGACYDENVLARLIYHADVTVSPGKIGLTVIHSLTYGTPAITHGDLDEQMPEVEAIEPGISGLLFERNSADDLARKIAEWLSRDVPRAEVRRACQRVIAEKWNPVRQRELIDAAIDSLFPSGDAR